MDVTLETGAKWRYEHIETVEQPPAGVVQAQLRDSLDQALWPTLAELEGERTRCTVLRGRCVPVDSGRISHVRPCRFATPKPPSASFFSMRLAKFIE